MSSLGPKNVTKLMLDQEMTKFTLSLYSNPLLSRKAIDSILQSFDNYTSDLFIPYVQTQMMNHLKPITDRNTHCSIQHILESSKHIFDKFKSEYSRFKIYEQECLYIPPESFKIGENKIFITNDSGVSEVTKKDIYAVHIPLKKTLEKVLSVPQVFEEILKYIKQLNEENIFMTNLMQGDLWKKKYHDANKIILPLIVYYDDFETRNCLGSHAGENKLGGVYVSLACLPPHMVGKLSNIFLSTLVHSKYVQKFGNAKVFTKIIDDLNILAKEGIELEINSQKRRVYFQCVQILGDNLGINSICGFSESFVANYFCRICSAKSSDCKVMTIENESLIRTVESYEIDVSKNNFAETGIHEKCVFNSISNFHICQNQTVDLMHDVFEGIASYTLGKILGSLLKENNSSLSLEIINNLIDNFPYNEVELHNKPRPLFFTEGKGGKKKIKIKQSAAELLCLTRYLGLMIGHKVSSNNKNWKLYLVLRKIIGILTSPKLTRGQITHDLPRLIHKHNAMYLELFEKLKPKMHLWVHYPRIMLQNGPVVFYSTMKYERKNKELKEFAVSSSNNINLPLTIAVRHQLLLSYKFVYHSNLDDSLQVGPVSDCNAHASLKTFIPNISQNVPVSTLKNVKILGRQFSLGTIFVIKICDEGPMFGIIKQIFYINNDNIYFVAQEYETMFFAHYYHAYQVRTKTNASVTLINVNLVPRLPPCQYFAKNENEFIATKYDF